MNLFSLVYALDEEPIVLQPTSIFTGAQGLTISQIINWALVTILVIAGVVFFFMLIIGGIRWILSGGDKANTEAARNQITAALIGLVVVFAAWALATLIGNIFGITFFSGGFDIGTISAPGGGGN